MFRERLILPCVAFGAVDVFLIVLLSIVVAVCSIAHPAQAKAATFAQSVKDRPVLESVQQVWQTQATGISELDFGGVRYVIQDLPRNYVAYSSWYCRMP